MTDDELREQLALAAVGALDRAERAELEDVLRTRPDLQAELDELRSAAALLADAVAERAAADAAGERPRRRSPTTPQLPRDRARWRRSPPVAAGRRPRSASASVAAASAAAAAMLVVGVLVVSPWSDGSADRSAAVLDADDARAIPMPGDAARS